MGCKDLGIRKLEFVAKTQIQYIIKMRLFSLIFLIKLKLCKTKNLQKKYLSQIVSGIPDWSGWLV